jgi:hypothetical protein
MDNIEMDLEEIGYEAVGWIKLTQEPEFGACKFGNTFSFSMKGRRFILPV